MGIYDKMGSTKPSTAKGNYLQDGSHVVVIDRCKHVEVSHNRKQYFIADLIMDEPDERSSHQPGENVAWMSNLTGPFPDMSLADVKAFIIAATGADDGDIDAAFMEEVHGAPNGPGSEGTMLQGIKIRVNARTRQNKNNDGTFTVCSFFPHNESEDESAA